MKCKYLDIECDKLAINDKQCAFCLSIKNVDLITELNDRITALEKPTPKKVTGRKPKAKVTGQL